MPDDDGYNIVLGTRVPIKIVVSNYTVKFGCKKSSIYMLYTCIYIRYSWAFWQKKESIEGILIRQSLHHFGACIQVDFHKESHRSYVNRNVLDFTRRRLLTGISWLEPLKPLWSRIDSITFTLNSIFPLVLEYTSLKPDHLLFKNLTEEKTITHSYMFCKTMHPNFYTNLN